MQDKQFFMCISIYALNMRGEPFKEKSKRPERKKKWPNRLKDTEGYLSKV
jgi:hypothetical protein